MKNEVVAKVGQDKDRLLVELNVSKKNGFDYRIGFTISEQAYALLMVMIGTALMLPKGSLFSCYEILELIGDDVYADIYDDEVYAIDYLFDLYFEKRCKLHHLYEVTSEDNAKAFIR
ncbi:hypothetical protein K4U42_10785 [Staphylococcus epidermidis]|nr:hypothetical protein [Staphylococcus epidermidis]MCG1328654.1 hypothetical protein [Staphylococcus epidermidis]MCG1885187.1 hypothetical protein [Staphylococcus epidermidis]MCG1932447.1 hypothetical protein [Staphylococcus epidermidis]MCG1934665.1 hypothetical protein [Staphylococcus epidermidis]